MQFLVYKTYNVLSQILSIPKLFIAAAIIKNLLLYSLKFRCSRNTVIWIDPTVMKKLDPQQGGLLQNHSYYYRIWTDIKR
jgi:hypothetical protein